MWSLHGKTKNCILKCPQKFPQEKKRCERLKRFLMIIILVKFLDPSHLKTQESQKLI